MPVLAGRLVFFQCKTANSFYSKVNDSSSVRTTAFAIRMPMKNLRTLRPKFFAGKTWYPLLWIKFFDTRNFLTHWREAHETFRHCETKNFCGKNVIHLIMHKIFRYPKISETLKWCPSNFFALWDRNFSPENRDITPFLSIEDFSFQKSSKTKNGSPAKFSRSCEKKTLTKLWSFPLLCLKNFDTRILSKHRRVLLRFLSAQWDKKFSTEFSDIPFLCIKNFDTRIFMIHRSVPQCNFLVLWDKKLERNVVVPPVMHKMFRYPKTSEILKGCPRIFSALWDQKFSLEKRDTPYYAQNFSIPQTFWNIEGMPTKVLAFVRHKNFDWKSWYAHSYP